MALGKNNLFDFKTDDSKDPLVKATRKNSRRILKVK